MRASRRSGGRARPLISPQVREGTYLRTSRELYYVECRGRDRVLLENCRTGVLLDASIEEVTRLEPVTPAVRVAQPA